jgi:hypothetical protein
MPSGVSKIFLELYNTGEGGCGNDVALDDIQFGLCDPQPTVTAGAASAGCVGGSTTFSALLSDTSIIAGPEDYQWQSSTDGLSWSNIAGATASTFTIASVTAADAKYYRVLVAAAGNITNTTCRYTSNSFVLNLKTPSTAPISASKNKANICPMEAVILTVNGGSLGTNAVWQWYSSGCGVGLVGSGQSITVNPSVNTTYYVRAEGDCNVTSCVPVQVVVNCNTTILDINILALNARLQGDQAILNWNLVTDKLIDHFEIERSADAVSFIKSGSVKMSASSQTNFDYKDDVSMLNVPQLYYRVKAVSREGNYKYSNVISLRTSYVKIALTPNPASSSVTLNLWSVKELKVEIKISDVTGKTIVGETEVVKAGNNTIAIPGIDRMSNGVYAVQILFDHKQFIQKLIIQK